MKLAISTKKFTLLLVLAVLFLSFTSLAAQFFMYVWGHEGLLSVLQAFNVGEDANIPTWYSSFTLLLCSILLAIIAAAKRRHTDSYTLHWGVLSIIFLLMSIDEVATIHEDFSGAFLGLTTGGFFYFSWVIPGAAFVLIVGLAYLRFLANLPRKIRRLFIMAGIIFVAGALGAEMLSAQLISPYGMENWGNIPDTTKMLIAIQTAIEELLEMLGIVVFIYALLSYISLYVKEVTVQFRTENE